MELTKQNKKTWLVSMSLALVCGLIGITSVASAQPPGGAGFRQGRLQRGGGPGGPDALMIPLGRLDLDDAQREQVRNVMRENRESRRTLGRAVREADGALEEAVAADVLDEQGIRAAANALGEAQGAAAVPRARLALPLPPDLLPHVLDALREELLARGVGEMLAHLGQIQHATDLPIPQEVPCDRCT